MNDFLRRDSAAEFRADASCLRIENLVLIREAEIELGSGPTAVTGETGGGKTIVTESLGLLLGNKAQAGLVRPILRGSHSSSGPGLEPARSA